MMNSLICCALLLMLCPGSFAETAAEVEAARDAAKRHNETVESAEQRLEREIARARADHAKAVIKAKERMIEDLRRAFRTAMRSDAPENSIKIAEQIKRLEKQATSLKEQAESNEAEKAKPQVKLKGLDPRLVGVIYVHGKRGNGGKHGRAYAISPEGKLRVLYDLDGGVDGIDVGSVYQGVIRGDEFVVHFVDWKAKGFSKGRMQALKITDEGQVNIRHGRFEDFEKNLSLTITSDYKDSYYESVDAFKAFIRGDDDSRDEDVPAKQPDTDKPEDRPPDVEDDNAGTATDDDAVDFFGIPMK